MRILSSSGVLLISKRGGVKSNSGATKSIQLYLSIGCWIDVRISIKPKCGMKRCGCRIRGLVWRSATIKRRAGRRVKHLGDVSRKRCIRLKLSTTNIVMYLTSDSHDLIPCSCLNSCLTKNVALFRTLLLLVHVRPERSDNTRVPKMRRLSSRVAATGSQEARRQGPREMPLSASGIELSFD